MVSSQLSAKTHLWTSASLCYPLTPSNCHVTQLSLPPASGTCVFSNFTKLFFEEKGRTPRLTAPMYGLVCFCCASVLLFCPTYRPTNQHFNAHAHIRPTEPVSTKFRSSRCARSICQRRTPCADANSRTRTRTAAALLLKFSPAFCCLDCMKCPS